MGQMNALGMMGMNLGRFPSMPTLGGGGGFGLQSETQMACASVAGSNAPLAAQWRAQRALIKEDKDEQERQQDKQARGMMSKMIPAFAAMQANQLKDAGRLTAADMPGTIAKLTNSGQEWM